MALKCPLSVDFFLLFSELNSFSNPFDVRVTQAPGIVLLVDSLKTSLLWIALPPTISLKFRLTSLFINYPRTQFDKRALLPLIVFLMYPLKHENIFN